MEIEATYQVQLVHTKLFGESPSFIDDISTKGVSVYG